MTGPEPMCERCKHLDRHDRPMGMPVVCTAFSHGIPAEIYVDGFNHRKPYPGDGGVRFEPVQEPDETP